MTIGNLVTLKLPQCYLFTKTRKSLSDKAFRPILVHGLPKLPFSRAPTDFNCSLHLYCIYIQWQTETGMSNRKHTRHAITRRSDG